MPTIHSKSSTPKTNVPKSNISKSLDSGALDSHTSDSPASDSPALDSQMSESSQQTNPKLHLISLGCTKNLVDSEVMLGRLQEYELTPHIAQADIIIINTCGFIQSAKQESIQTILNAAKQKSKNAILVVSGCLSERYQKELEEQMPEIDILIGVRDYDKIDTFLAQKGFAFATSAHTTKTKNTPAHISTNLSTNANNDRKAQGAHILQSLQPPNPQNLKTPPNSTTPQNLKSLQNPQSPISRNIAIKNFSTTNSSATNSTTKNFSTNNKVFLATESDKRVITGSSIHAYIKLSEGCNQSCSFCSIPSFKGKLQSRSIESILKEIELLSAQGFRDFSFIAQDSSSYLRDFGLKDGLSALIKAIDSQNIAKNARIHYLYPSTTSPKLIESIIDSPIIQNYFDMPIQHISDSMLKRMKRGGGKKDILQLIALMKQAPNAFLRSTFIIGHPGESEREFEELCDFVREGLFHQLNLFAFSSEEGTLADMMEDKIPAKTTNARLNTLNKSLKAQNKSQNTALKGQILEVILEGKSAISEFFYSARDRKWGVEIDGEILINDTHISNLTPGFYQAQITDYKQNLLFGTILKSL